MASSDTQEFQITNQIPDHRHLIGGPRPKDPVERFMNFIEFEPNTGCWLWNGGSIGNGYGSFSVGSRSDGTKKTLYAHRFSYETFIGPIPIGIKILHKCDNPPCVNPEHFFLGTQYDNCVDMATKMRGVKSKNGLPYGAAIKSNGKFIARVRFKGKLISLGVFNTPEEASEIALKKKLELANENN